MVHGYSIQDALVQFVNMRFYFRFQAFSSSRTLKPKKSDKESPSGRQHSSELLSRLAMLEEQVMMMGNQLNKVN